MSPAKNRHLEGVIDPTSCADYRVVAILGSLAKEQVTSVPSVRLLAVSLNISPSRLRHIFKSSTGLSFNQYVKRLRLQRARQLLLDTHLSVKQVMIEVGIFDHSHFAKDYRKEFGETPSQTRRTVSPVKTALAFAYAAAS